MDNKHSDFTLKLCSLVEGLWNRVDICPQIDARELAEHLDLDEIELATLVDQIIEVADDADWNKKEER